MLSLYWMAHPCLRVLSPTPLAKGHNHNVHCDNLFYIFKVHSLDKWELSQRWQRVGRFAWALYDNLPRPGKIQEWWALCQSLVALCELNQEKLLNILQNLRENFHTATIKRFEHWCFELAELRALLWGRTNAQNFITRISLRSPSYLINLCVDDETKLSFEI